MRFINRSQKVSLEACIGINLGRTRDIPNLFLTCCRFTSPNEAFCFYNQQVICFFVIAPFLNFVVKIIYNKFKNLNILWLSQNYTWSDYQRNKCLVGPAAWALHRSSRKPCHSYLPKGRPVWRYFSYLLVVSRPPEKVEIQGRRCHAPSAWNRLKKYFKSFTWGD